MAKKSNLSIAMELIELRLAVIEHCADLRCCIDMLLENTGTGKARAVRKLGLTVERLYDVSLRHAKVHGYKEPTPRAR